MLFFDAEHLINNNNLQLINNQRLVKLTGDLTETAWSNQL